MFPLLKHYLAELTDFASLPAERIERLDSLATYIRRKLDAGQPARLTFICTHNSRRSHFGQVWAQVAAHFYGISPVECYSGGTEVTACNPRTAAALERAGIRVQRITGGGNPVYLLQYADGVPPLAAFSKVYDQPPNPASAFAAVMTCSQAEANCPYVPGAEKRFSITYDDPKSADGAPEEGAVYDARCRQIAQEMMFVFSRVQEAGTPG